MGLFDMIKKKQQTKQVSQEEVDAILDKVDQGHRQRKADLEYQNVLLSRVNAAREKYKTDKDIQSAIREYEFAFVESDPPCKTSQDIDLADLYIKAEEYDKAWGYLNQLMLRRNYPDPDIRFHQAKILRNEGKYAYAVEMFALGYYYKSIPNNDFQVERFQKDISSSVKKLGWDQKMIDEIVRIVTAYPHKDNSSETKLINHLREYLKADNTVR